MASPETAWQNQILASLHGAGYQRLQPHLELVSLALGEGLYEVGEPITHVYFPLDALISLISLVDHAVTEFGLIGNEGLVGIPALLGGNSTISQAITQVAGNALRIEAHVLKTEFDRGEILQRQLLLYVQLFLTQTAQNGACQIHHPIVPRLARWLLSIHDRLHQEHLSLTQQYIADLLGTRRATITEAAGHLQQQGIIRYRRGEITILDRTALEQASCRCYGVLQREQARLRAISQTLR